MAKFKFENLKFEQIMKDYATIREQTIPDAVHSNARLLCVEFARRTQPFGNDENMGKERVRKDISNVIKPPIYFLKFLDRTKNPRLQNNLRKLFFNRRFGDIQQVLNKIGFGGRFAVVASSSMPGVHKANRNPRTGRAFSRPDKFYIAEDSSSLSNYIQTKQKMVGLAKSGWAECAKQLRRVTGSATRGIPSWVTRHSAGLGDVQDRTGNPFAPVVVLSNRLPWADQVLRPSEQLNGMAIVAQKMKRQMEMILKKRQLKLQEAA